MRRELRLGESLPSVPSYDSYYDEVILNLIIFKVVFILVSFRVFRDFVFYCLPNVPSTRGDIIWGLRVARYFKNRGIPFRIETPHLTSSPLGFLIGSLFAYLFMKGLEGGETS